MTKLSHGLRGQRQGAGTAIGHLLPCACIPIIVPASYLHRIIWKRLTDNGTVVRRFGTVKGEPFAFDAEQGLDNYQGTCMGLISFETWRLAPGFHPSPPPSRLQRSDTDPALTAKSSLCGPRSSNIHLVKSPPMLVKRFSNTSVSVMVNRGVHSNSTSPTRSLSNSSDLRTITETFQALPLCSTSVPFLT